MNPFLRGAFIIALGVGGSGAGIWLARRRKWGWSVVAAGLLGSMAFALAYPQWGLRMPLCWLVAGRMECYLIALLAPLLVASLTGVVHSAVLRGVMFFGAAFWVLHFALLPGIGSYWTREELCGLRTHLDSNGVCTQSTGYNCGPAALVTALQKCGISAEEGELGLALETSYFNGTPADLLADFVSQRYGKTLPWSRVTSRMSRPYDPPMSAWP